VRLLEQTIGKVRIFSDRPFGYKRYYVNWGKGEETMFSGLWYKLPKIVQIVEQRVNGETTT
tara:strand:- start:411 stop:593 length:183 start_codon:yes stop_codon:yes gene_type:complete